MAVSGLSYRKALVGTRWPISVVFGIKGLRKKQSHLVGPPFPTFRFSATQVGIKFTGSLDEFIKWLK